ncbi:uncharacterized protein LOC132697076 [Cylas formicarius]|uniref:uncharacterized protein LOC132697076 n=1 Tax=Cylas formicarius TaxID=197179 RepID=UPI002958A2A7|nr:uncharacterized protein LOC132697076 [Cylas formicarius]
MNPKAIAWVLVNMAVHCAFSSTFESTALVQTLDNSNETARDAWSGSAGTCTNVQRRDLVYYNHANLMFVSSGSTLTSTYTWNGAKFIYCIELVTNYGTSGQVTSGGVGYQSAAVEVQSRPGKDLEAIIFIYAD